jgi:transcriptional regulator CtsR
MKGVFIMRLSDTIEQFIKDLLNEESTEVELKRNELAEYFGCAPSQINYVLATRFSPDHGYLTESRRGGGGYIRIVRVVQTGSQRLMYLVNDRIGDSLEEEECIRLISQLKDQGIVTADEAALMASAVSARALSVPVPDALKNAMRAKMMKSMLMAVASRNRK